MDGKLGEPERRTGFRAGRITQMANRLQVEIVFTGSWIRKYVILETFRVRANLGLSGI